LKVDRATPRLIGRGDLLAALDPAAAKKVTILSAPAVISEYQRLLDDRCWPP
jgi:hypothetical protein